MIDVCMVIHKNYNLLDLQLEHLKKFKNVGTAYVIDNTPTAERKQHPYPNLEWVDLAGIDGTTHGLALDLLVKKAKTDVICIQDSDFFWLDKTIFEDAEEWYKAGYKNIGCAGFYPDWQANIDTRYPDRGGSLAPVCWGMFVDRQLASEQTFCVTAEEAAQVHETGWRLRKRVIDENIPRLIFEGFSSATDPNLCFFRFGRVGSCIEGVHLLKGSAGREGLTETVPTIIGKYMC